MADILTHQNEYGSIQVTRSVMVQMVSEIISETDGVQLAAVKRKFPAGKTSMEISLDEDAAPEIKVYVIVDFGTSISAVTYSLINEIKNRMNKVLETVPSSISITIVGTKTNHGVAKRDIEVKRDYDITD